MSDIMKIRWKKKVKKSNTKRSKGVAQARMKVWKINFFVACLS